MHWGDFFSPLLYSYCNNGHGQLEYFRVKLPQEDLGTDSFSSGSCNLTTFVTDLRLDLGLKDSKPAPQAGRQCVIYLWQRAPQPLTITCIVAEVIVTSLVTYSSQNWTSEFCGCVHATVDRDVWSRHEHILSVSLCRDSIRGLHSPYWYRRILLIREPGAAPTLPCASSLRELNNPWTPEIVPDH